ncbi:MAG: hypothetical protein AAGG44_04205 [Planctomycetota bacterium]
MNSRSVTCSQFRTFHAVFTGLLFGGMFSGISGDTSVGYAQTDSSRGVQIQLTDYVQDVKPEVSPSDLVPQTTTNVSLQLSDLQSQAGRAEPSQPSSVPSAPTQPAPQSSTAGNPPVTSSSNPAANQAQGPNVANIGNNRLNVLSRSGVYASPVALSLGLGGTQASASVGRYFGSAVHRNLLQTPEMFGDFRRPGTSLTFFPVNHSSGTSGAIETDDDDAIAGIDFPSAQAFSGMRVSENNVALPQDRIWTSYHHFNNAFNLPTGNLDLDRFILGFEKTFNGGSSSIEVRLPIAGSLDPVDATGNTAFAGGSFGNLGLIYKRVLLANADRVIAAGLRVETPTGSQWHSSDSSGAEFSFAPRAVYLTPFIGALREYDDIWFVNSFLQLDIATGGDRLRASLNGNPAQDFFIDQPPLLQIDVGGGVWLVTPSQQSVGLALLSEIHVATALADDDSFAVDPNFGGANVFVEDVPIRNVVNLTNGLHIQFSELFSVRTAFSVPLLEDRIFDSEFMVQINRNY